MTRNERLQEFMERLESTPPSERYLLTEEWRSFAEGADEWSRFLYLGRSVHETLERWLLGKGAAKVPPQLPTPKKK